MNQAGLSYWWASKRGAEGDRGLVEFGDTLPCAASDWSMISLVLIGTAARVVMTYKLPSAEDVGTQLRSRLQACSIDSSHKSSRRRNLPGENAKDIVSASRKFSPCAHNQALPSFPISMILTSKGSGCPSSARILAYWLEDASPIA